MDIVVKAFMDSLHSATGTCPTKGRTCIATAAGIIGSKWTPQLIYALSHGVQHFCNLQKEVGGVNPRTLSARLDELEHVGIVTKMVYTEVPSRVEYSLTAKGRDLLPILQRMVEWGEKYAKASATTDAVKPSSL